MGDRSYGTAFFRARQLPEPFPPNAEPFLPQAPSVPSGAQASIGGQTAPTADVIPVEGPNIRCVIAPAGGLPVQIETLSGNHQLARGWLTSNIDLVVSNEYTMVSGAIGKPLTADGSPGAQSAAIVSLITNLSLLVTQKWSVTNLGLLWDIDLVGTGPRAGHHVSVGFPILSPKLQLFLPTAHGARDLSAYRSSAGPQWYSAQSWTIGESYLLPLASVFDPSTDEGLTIALAADEILPFYVEWSDARFLRFHFVNRALGGGKSSPIRFRLFSHRADYRSVVQTFADWYPAYFRPVLPRGPYEGPFYFDNIQFNPDLEEISRQNLRYVWSCFWFTHMGEFLPDASEWRPFTFGAYGELMTDDRIRSFIRARHDQNIGTYAYFNLNEWGGADWTATNTSSLQTLFSQFPDSLLVNLHGDYIDGFAQSLYVNPRPQNSIYQYYLDQIMRHVTRLPELDGFIIDRLDTAQGVDWSHDDGTSMAQNRPYENMAGPIVNMLGEMTQIAHAHGMRVFGNQIYQLAIAGNLDGICAENFEPAAALLCPFKPLSCWSPAVYDSDLLALEGQLKQRLQSAMLPHVIAHERGFAQQRPDPEAADLMEVYAPLFGKYIGKEQVLTPHCVSVTGPNDANLFHNPGGEYLVPISSRVQFLSRAGRSDELVRIRLRTSDAGELTWAHAYTADGSPYRVELFAQHRAADILVPHHQTATMVVAGKGIEPPLEMAGLERLDAIRAALFHSPPATSSPAMTPNLATFSNLVLYVQGASIGPAGIVNVLVDDAQVGELSGSQGSFRIPGRAWEVAPSVTILTSDDGTWFAPEQVELWGDTTNSASCRLATWMNRSYSGQSTPKRLILPLSWSEMECQQRTLTFEGKDTKSQGQWVGRLGNKGYWIPEVHMPETNQYGFRLSVTSVDTSTWNGYVVNDPRVLESASGEVRAASCWWGWNTIDFQITPTNTAPYRVTLYLLDYDHNNRSMDVKISENLSTQDGQGVSISETVGGVYLTWRVQGPVSIKVSNVSGANAVVSGLFLD